MERASGGAKWEDGVFEAGKAVVALQGGPGACLNGCCCLIGRLWGMSERRKIVPAM